MNKNSTRTRQPRPSASRGSGSGPIVPPSALNKPGQNDTETAVAGTDATLLADNPNPARRNNVFTLAASNVSQQAVAKMEALGVIRQRLAEASDYFGQGEDEAKKAQEVADDAALRLYQARTAGLLSADEVTGVLGDAFGYKVTSKGEQSKTPNGQGEAIRKRIVRAVGAAEFVSTGEGGRFFEGLPKKKVEDVVSRLNEGGVSLFRTYDILADIKRENATRTNPAFDPKRIAALVATLSEPDSRAIVLDNPGLVAAYGALIDVLLVIGEKPEAKANAA